MAMLWWPASPPFFFFSMYRYCDVQEIEDGVFEDVDPPGVALVPVTPTLYRAHKITFDPSQCGLRHAADRNRRTRAANLRAASRSPCRRALRLPRPSAQGFGRRHRAAPGRRRESRLARRRFAASCGAGARLQFRRRNRRRPRRSPQQRAARLWMVSSTGPARLKPLAARMARARRVRLDPRFGRGRLDQFEARRTGAGAAPRRARNAMPPKKSTIAINDSRKNVELANFGRITNSAATPNTISDNRLERSEPVGRKFLDIRIDSPPSYRHPERAKDLGGSFVVTVAPPTT